MTNDPTGALLALGAAIVIVLSGWVFVRAMARRMTPTIGAKPTNTVAAMSEHRVAVASQTQIERVFAIIDHASRSAERAVEAQVMAARHLDSAEYQLQRLFDEFPMLSVACGRARQTLPAVAGQIVPAPRALAA